MNMMAYPMQRIQLSPHSVGNVYRLRSGRQVRVLSATFTLGNSMEVQLQDARNGNMYTAVYLPNGTQTSVVRSQDMVERLS